MVVACGSHAASVLDMRPARVLGRCLWCVPVCAWGKPSIAP